MTRNERATCWVAAAAALLCVPLFVEIQDTRWAIISALIAFGLVVLVVFFSESP